VIQAGQTPVLAHGRRIPAQASLGWIPVIMFHVEHFLEDNFCVGIPPSPWPSRITRLRRFCPQDLEGKRVRAII